MLISYLKIALRHLLRDRWYTVLNISSLSIGFCCFLVLFAYIRFEYSYDSHYPDAARIYRLNSHVTLDGELNHSARSGQLAGPLLARDNQGLADYMRVQWMGEDRQMQFIVGEDVFRSSDAFQADAGFFRFFGYRMLAGDADSALQQPKTIALSERYARLLFGQDADLQSLPGRSVGIQARGNDYTVTAVFADLPANTSLRPEIVFSDNNPITIANQDNFFERIVYFEDYTFFKLDDGFDIASFERISEVFFSRYVSEAAAQLYPQQNARLDLSLQPLQDIYLHPGLEDELLTGNPRNLSVLSAIALLALLIASVNYMNIATARTPKRARESGMRRVLGSSSTGIALQFVVEALVFSLLALVIAYSLTEILLSTAGARALLGHDLSLRALQNPSVLLQLLLVAVVTGCLAGAWPALLYTRTRPADVFKGVTAVSRRGLPMRLLLVALQSVISVFIILCAVFMYRQVRFMQDQPLGFATDNILNIKLDGRPQASAIRALMDRLRAHEHILGATQVDVPLGETSYAQPAVLLDDQGHEVNRQLDWFIVDDFFLDTFGVELLAGSNLGFQDVPSTEGEIKDYLVNQRLVDLMGWQQPLGQEFRFPVDGVRGRVIGVISDFHFVSLHEQIRPLVLEAYSPDYRWQRQLYLRLAPEFSGATLEFIRNQVEALSANVPFQYSFLESDLGRLYAQESKQVKLISTGSLVSVFIALLGIVGLITYVIEQNAREIGIRKVLGAGLMQIIRQLFSRLLLCNLLAYLLAALLAWWLLDAWLSGFAYRIELQFWLIAACMAAMLLLTLALILLLSLKLTSNTIYSALRYE